MGSPASVLADVLDLVLPRVCGGCGAPGERWCRACASAVVSAPFVVVPRPPPAGLPPTWAATSYDGPTRRALHAYKDLDRRDLVEALAPLLATALVGAVLGCGPRVVVVPVPSRPAARARRGDVPLETLARAAARAVIDARGVSPPVVGALRVRRRVADQAALDHDARQTNVAGAFQARDGRRGDLLARADVVVIVDDVVTTGATLAEAARAVRAVTSADVRAAAVAATTLRMTRLRPSDPTPRRTFPMVDERPGQGRQ